jgi:hypothetical protein
VIDWNAKVLAPVMGVFGEPVTYLPAIGSPFDITGVFDEAFTSVDLPGDSAVLSVRPVLGIRLAEFPAGFDPEMAQGDQFTVQRTGVTYTVKAGKPDGHGWARLDANIV